MLDSESSITEAWTRLKPLAELRIRFKPAASTDDKNPVSLLEERKKVLETMKAENDT